MTKKSKNGLTVRRLKPKDAADFVKVSYGEGMFQYLPYFHARNVSEAEKIITQNNRYGNSMYGLFTKRNVLVSVFYVSQVVNGSAEISYFTGEMYRGNNYTATGLKLLAELLRDTVEFFSFAIKTANKPSLSVQQKLGSLEKESGTGSYRHFVYATA